MLVQTYTKLQLAEIQLEGALQLFFDDTFESNDVCAITLAGAAEELLGKLLEQRDESGEFKTLVDKCTAVGREVYGEDWPKKIFSQILGFPKNELKHIGDSEPVAVCRELALSILGRAVSNYRMLTGQESVLMKRLTTEIYGL